MTLSIMTLGLMTLSIMKRSIRTFGTMTLCIILNTRKFSITAFVTTTLIQHYGIHNGVLMAIVIMLSVFMFSVIC
jgi:hypothetical protein